MKSSFPIVLNSPSCEVLRVQIFCGLAFYTLPHFPTTFLARKGCRLTMRHSIRFWQEQRMRCIKTGNYKIMNWSREDGEIKEKKIKDRFDFEIKNRILSDVCDFQFWMKIFCSKRNWFVVHNDNGLNEFHLVNSLTFCNHFLTYGKVTWYFCTHPMYPTGHVPILKAYLWKLHEYF